MGSSQPFLRAALREPSSASALVASGLAIAGPRPCRSLGPDGGPTAALPTVQVDGVVWSQTVSAASTSSAARSITRDRPEPPQAPTTTARSNLFAYDVTTGCLAARASPRSTNDWCSAIAASPDGSRIYIAGDFTQVNGQTRDHLAALDLNGDPDRELRSELERTVHGASRSRLRGLLRWCSSPL